mgnify:CR=1 FL=1
MTPELHPLTQKYPPMEAEEFAAFRADLAAHGQKNPIWLFEGKVLDGRNRLRACLELGLDPLFAEFAGTEAEAAAFVDSQNLHRRHLSREWRQQRVRELRERGLSTWVIAQQVGCSQATVRRDLVSEQNPAPPVPCHTNRESVESDDSTDSPTADTTDGGLPQSVSRPESDPGSVESCGSAETTAREPEPHRVVKPNPMPSPQQPRVQGRDGKSYRAERPDNPKPKPAPKEKAQWSELASVLTELAQKVETLVPTPAENERPWELISSLEATARSLLRQAERLKRRHHL